MTIPWRPAPAYVGRHRAPRVARRPLVNEERIPTQFLADVVRLMRPGALSLDPALIGDGLDIDDAMRRAGVDADDALTAWRAAS